MGNFQGIAERISEKVEDYYFSLIFLFKQTYWKVYYLSFIASEKINYLHPPLLVRRLTEYAKMPERYSEDAAGYDLFSPSDEYIKPGENCFILLDLAFSIPKGHYGRIANRSSMAKNDIIVICGVIDRDFRGNVKVGLRNLGEHDYRIRSGDRIAQLILEKISTPQIIETEYLSNTKRGSNGWGSTGK